MQVTKAITINRPPEDVYHYWRDFQHLPQFLSHLQSVQVTDDRHSHWVTQAPAGRMIEWDAELIEDHPNELIAWCSVEDADVPNSGRVQFRPAPDGRGTELVVALDYDPP